MSFALDSSLQDTLAEVRSGRVVVLTGAGISAESGIPTFRGPEGYWTVGSREYHPQEMARGDTFVKMPREVWHWYLYRRQICRAAAPNAAHQALVELEQALADRFSLVTQNVDGLHLRAGHSRDRTYEVHGNIDFMRCTRGCGTRGCSELIEVPDFGPVSKDGVLDEKGFARLKCDRCGGPSRPHVLWFDERYDEDLYRSDSAMDAVSHSDLLLVVGSSGAASLPLHAAAEAARVGAAIVDVNPEDNPFAEFACSRPRGHWARGTAAAVLPTLVQQLI